MWDDCGFSPNLGLEVLSLMSLVKIVPGNGGNWLWMHDQLRDLGRSIVSKGNSVKPSERSRLWIHEEALKVLERNEVQCFQLSTFYLPLLGYKSGLKVWSLVLKKRRLWVESANL